MEALKLEGNELFKQKKYSEAVVKYTQAIGLDPQNAVLYSNRSAAHDKLGSYEAAVEDASECIRLKPGWYKGYYRKITALAALDDHAEVAHCAEQGFRVTGEKAPKDEFIKRWLHASLILNKLPEGCGVELPDGIHILSQDYALVVAYLHRSLSGEHPMSQGIAQECLKNCGSQLETLLAAFGEPTCPSIKEFVHYLPLELYPQETQTPTKIELEGQAKVLGHGEKLVSFLVKDVDPAVYPVLRPVLALIILVVLSRTNVLCETNTGHRTAELMNRSILLLFDANLLGIPEYSYLYIGRLCAVLDSFDGRGHLLSPTEIATLQHYCAKLEVAIEKYPRHFSDFSKNKDLADRALENAKRTISRPLNYMPTSVVDYGINAQNASSFIATKPKEVEAFAIQRFAELEAVTYLTMAETGEIIDLAGILHSLNDNSMAMKMFQYGEQCFFSVLANHLEKGALRLDQCASTIAPIRQLVLWQAKRFNNAAVFADVTLRWKGLFGEFRAQLIQKGLGKPMAACFRSYTQNLASPDINSIQQLIADEETILKQAAQLVLTNHSRQSCSLLQQKLDEKTIVLNYVTYIPLDQQMGVSCCVLLEAGKEPAVFDLNNKAIKVQASVVVDFMTKIRDYHSKKEDASALENRLEFELLQLSSVVLPECIAELLLSSDKDHMYISLNQDLASIPFDMLTLQHSSHGQIPLSSKFSVSIFSSSWNLLSSCDESAIDSFETCYIISNPNFDLGKDVGILHSLTSLFSDYFSLSDSGATVVDHLKHSKSEADFIEYILNLHGLGVKRLSGDEATLANVLAMCSPSILHFSTHAYGFSRKTAYRDTSFFSELECTIALAGFNTYSRKQLDRILPECSIGQLPSLAIASMELKKTKLVYLSTCNSSLGKVAVQESVDSLAEAFFSAGAKTVIATLWTIHDAAASEFAKFFYDKLLSHGTRPSQALSYAKNKMKEDLSWSHWRHWAGFVCYGVDEPIMSVQ